MAKHLLTDAQLRSMIPGSYHDGGGLYLEIRSDTSASWHLRFTMKGRKSRLKMGLGSYPEISLARARDLARENRSLAAEGKNPIAIRKELRRQGMSIEDALTELFEKKRDSLKGGGEAGRWWSPVATHIIPAIGNVGVADLTVSTIVEKLGRVYIEKPATGDKLFTRLKMALDYAAAQDDRVKPEIVDRAKIQLPRKRTLRQRQDEGHHPALDWRNAPRLWASLDTSLIDTCLAFYLLTLPRVANIAEMRWPEVDLMKAVWTIPPENTKTGVSFDAPLTPPALDILKTAKRFALADAGDLVFPNPKGRKTRNFHVNFLNNRLQRDEWPSTTKGKLAVAHGLRSTFSTYLVSNGVCDARLAEMSIQHEVRTKQERAYQRADLLKQRRAILERWADWLLSASKEKHRHRLAMNSEAETSSDRTRLDVERWARAAPDEE